MQGKLEQMASAPVTSYPIQACSLLSGNRSFYQASNQLRMVLLCRPRQQTCHCKGQDWPCHPDTLLSNSVTIKGSVNTRFVIKSREPGISPGYYECGPRLLLWENRRKIEPKEIPSCLIPRLIVVFTRQLEILVTTLKYYSRLQLKFSTAN